MTQVLKEAPKKPPKLAWEIV